jgi:hypothetical protein
LGHALLVDPGVLPHGGLGPVVQVGLGFSLFCLMGLSFHVSFFVFLAHSCCISFYTCKTRVYTKTMEIDSVKHYLL